MTDEPSLDNPKRKGRPQSPETRAKISAALTGRRVSAEALANMAAAQAARRGYRHTQETRDKMKGAGIARWRARRRQYPLTRRNGATANA